MNRGFSRGLSPILVTAALSVAVLISAAGMQLGKAFAKPLPVDPTMLEPAKRPSYLAIEDEDANGTPDWQDELVRAGIIATSTATSSQLAASSTDPLARFGISLAGSLISGYLSLAEYNAYTPERGETLANTIADNFRAPVTFVPHTVNDLSLDSDVSEERVRRYRADMGIALEPLISSEEYELTLYAAFVDTGDRIWLDRLSASADRYFAAKNNLLKMSVPQDAAPEHLRLVNALGSFSETLQRMVRFANDPLASMALLTTYNEREREFNLAFDALIKYYARTIGAN